MELRRISIGLNGLGQGKLTVEKACLYGRCVVSLSLCYEGGPIESLENRCSCCTELARSNVIKAYALTNTNTQHGTRQALAWQQI